MTGQPLRAASGGQIRRDQTLSFTFDGKRYPGHPGDTLASALIANGVRMVGRSFKYHRPRGVLSAGSEEPNALVTLGRGGREEPNTRATEVDLHDGLVARSQNAWPSLAFDLGAINAGLAPLIPAGFYYKTFIGGPKGAWTRLYEPAIRRMAGLGRAPAARDPDRYDKRHAHCDVLVVGAGPAGLAAADAAAAGGARVILIDERDAVGGSLLATDETIDGAPAGDWTQAVEGRLAAASETRVLLRTTAFGRYDHNLVMAVERLPAGRRETENLRQRLWQIRARHVILATGAHEQPLLFGGNDLPGVMLAGAGRMYARRYGALAGRRIVVATNNDTGYAAARALRDAGAAIVAVVDGRSDVAPGQPFEVIPSAAIRRANGRRAVESVEIATADDGARRLACDAVLMSGGWQPALHLHSHAGGRTRFDAELGCFVPGDPLPGVATVGGCAGRFALDDCLGDGHEAGAHRAAEAGFGAHTPRPRAPEPAPLAGGAVFRPPLPAMSFVDFQNDVTSKDIDLAVREGFVSVEHLKRYTTSGMATDQGKLSNLNAITRLGERSGRAPAEVGVTTFRPPYTPVAFGALAGLDRGDLLDPIRLTPMHGWHVARGAVFEDVGQWKRPRYFPVGGETMAEAVRRECLAVRRGVGMLDASTLGKIDIRGPDAARFLNLVYANAWLKLEVGRCRYGVMCGEDGMVLDDGVTTRLGPDRFLMTTTTSNAARVLDHLEDLLQTEWPHLRAYLTSVTDHWSVSVVTGPLARQVVERAVSGPDLSNLAFPHLSMREAAIDGVRVRLFRISFTGELSYEVHAPAQHGRAVWERLFETGRDFGVTAYGTETMHVLRAEKGYIVVGQETDGAVSPEDLGLGWAIARSKPDFVGKRSLARSDTARADRPHLVGLVPLDRATVAEEGAQLTPATPGPASDTILGWVTSSYWSATLGHPIALALLENGRNRHGETVQARWGGRSAPCRVGEPMFYDPDGERLHG